MQVERQDPLCLLHLPDKKFARYKLVVSLHPVKLIQFHNEKFSVIQRLDTIATISHRLFSTGISLDDDPLLFVDEQLRVINHDVLKPEKLKVTRPLVLLDPALLILNVFKRLFWVDDGEVPV